MDYPIRLVGQLRAHLQALRKLRGLTQAQLGARLGLSQVRIAEIEANPGVVSVDQLVRILSALGANLVLRTGVAASDSMPAPTRPSTVEPSGKARRASTEDIPPPPSPVRKSTTRAARKAPAATPPLTPRKGSW